MAFRDDRAVLEERIDQLELSLAKTAGKSMLLEEERDALRAELEDLTRDPMALTRIRKDKFKRSALFAAMRIFGALGVAFTLVPMLVMAAIMAFNGEPGAGLVCGIFPAVAILGVMLLKMPEILQATELRVERRRRAAREAVHVQRATQVRVEEAPELQEVEAPIPSAPESAKRAQ